MKKYKNGTVLRRVSGFENVSFLITGYDISYGKYTVDCITDYDIKSVEYETYISKRFAESSNFKTCRLPISRRIKDRLDSFINEGDFITKVPSFGLGDNSSEELKYLNKITRKVLFLGKLSLY